MRGSMGKFDLPFFEGAEKALEIWFTRKDLQIENCDLRRIPEREVRNILKLVNCTVLSFSKNEYINAYLLSESSMFITKRQFILKTCGMTTPLRCLETLKEVAMKYSGFDEIADYFYSHKGFMKPEIQPYPYFDFKLEVEVLNTVFNDGKAYCLGQELSNALYLYSRAQSKKINKIRSMEDSDQTLEIIMTDLDPDVMRIFTKNVSITPEIARKVTSGVMSSYHLDLQASGLDALMGGFQWDDHLFDPCGYSLNAINKSGHYVTVHVTPESDYSYASYETNFPLESIVDMVFHILAIMRPSSSIVTFCANETSKTCLHLDSLKHLAYYHNYLVLEIDNISLQKYDLTYVHFVKFPS